MNRQKELKDLMEQHNLDRHQVASMLTDAVEGKTFTASQVTHWRTSRRDQIPPETLALLKILVNGGVNGKA